MGEVIPIEKAIDKEIRLIREKQKMTLKYIEELERIREGHLTAMKNPAVANAEFIELIESELAEIDYGIKEGKEAIRKSELLISEKLDRMESFMIGKKTEIKIR